tara:strand:- start:1046 stop:2224 length:1179 start_codon:yes stop_codon:yes gene_type:complete
MIKSKNIVVVGLGYVGTANAVMLAKNNNVIGIDLDVDRVKNINNKISPVTDLKITEFLQFKSLNLFATCDTSKAYKSAEIVIIATPTNYNPTTQAFDTTSVESVIKEVTFLNPEAVIVIKSTIPIGFTSDVSKKYKTNNVIFSPEFLREGNALHDCLFPSRIVVGEQSERAKEFAQILLSGAERKDAPIILMGAQEAEAIKLFSNTYLAMRVAFFNEIDSFSINSNMDTKQIIDGVCLDPRIGDHYNNPSFGYGGYCLPKDTKQLLTNYSQVPQNLIKAIIESNTTRQDYLVDVIVAKNPKVVGIYRVIMKQGSDNFRSSAIQGIIDRLIVKGIKIIIYEPLIDDSNYLKMPLVQSLIDFKRQSDLIVANRLTEELTDNVEKVFTRDLYGIN